MSPKEIAAELRSLADRAGISVGGELRRLANKIDPLKSQCLDPGIVVRFSGGDFGIVTENGIASLNEDGVLIENIVASGVKPVHILADDEVAVKRSQIQALLGEVGK